MKRKKKINLLQLEQKYSSLDYNLFYNYIQNQIKLEKLIPIKNKKFNGKSKPLYMDYWLITEELDISEELRYLHGYINKKYYEKKPSEFEKDKKYILRLSRYFYENKENLQTPMSINERSFEIFGEEKFLKERGKSFFNKKVKVPIDYLNIYNTPEPFVYYSSNRNTPQHIWIIENKDTWYTLRKLLLEGYKTIYNIPIDTIIYLAGKSKGASLKDFEEALNEPLLLELHLTNKDNIFLYWGDIDYEGIIIYEGLNDKFSSSIDIKLNTKLYEKMIDKYLENKIDLPITKEGQNKNIKNVFLSNFSSYFKNQLMKVLDNDYYIPQEILSYMELKRGSK